MQVLQQNRFDGALRDGAIINLPIIIAPSLIPQLHKLDDISIFNTL